MLLLVVVGAVCYAAFARGRWRRARAAWDLLPDNWIQVRLTSEDVALMDDKTLLAYRDAFRWAARPWNRGWYWAMEELREINWECSHRKQFPRE